MSCGILRHSRAAVVQGAASDMSAAVEEVIAGHGLTLIEASGLLLGPNDVGFRHGRRPSETASELLQAASESLRARLLSCPHEGDLCSPGERYQGGRLEKLLRRQRVAEVPRVRLAAEAGRVRLEEAGHMGMRVLVVGQAPARGSRRGSTLGPETASGRRLRALLPGGFEAVNLRGDFPGKNPGSRCPRTGRLRNCGDRFPGPSRRGISRVLDAMFEHDVVVLLGRRVAGYVGEELGYGRRWAGLPFFTSVDLGDGMSVWLAPHPSGTSRWWNDPANAEAARRFFDAVSC